VATLFAAFLGYNPVKTLLGSGIHHVPAAQQHVLLGHTFFPAVISPPFAHALQSAFIFGLVAMLVAAAASAVPAKGQPWFGSRRRGGVEPLVPVEAPIDPASAAGEALVRSGARD
jgi:hypothetical protein